MTGVQTCALPICLAETEDLVIVNKPRGMLTHGPDGLDELVRRYYADRAANSLAFTPAPLHRLDRNTSGALAVSKSLKGARDFSQALREGRIGKEYLAVLDGSMGSSELWTDLLVRDGDGKVTAPCDLAPRVQDGVHAGREARSLAVPLARAHGKTLALIRLYTGLTHQIRAQAAARGYPLAGDNKYGGSPFAGGYILHCARLILPVPLFGPAEAILDAPLPADAASRIEACFGPLSSMLPPPG